MIRTLYLPGALRLGIEALARGAFPNECCGLIEGVLDGQTARATMFHPVRNLSPQADRFELDPVQHIALLRGAREKGRALIGCYHSHPNGRPEPSDKDRAGAGEEDFLWLIAARVDGTAMLRAFVYAKGAFAPVELEATTTATL